MAVITARRPGTRSAIIEVEREGIQFWNVTPERVRIEIVVHNRGTVRSQATPMIIQSAPLGAFLPWRPLGKLMVPPVEPESSVQLQMDVDRTPSAPLGEFSRVPPARLLTALSAGDADDADVGVGAPRGGLFKGLTQPPRIGLIGSPGGVLAPNIFALLDHCTLHWVGNINVFLGQRSVERHMARALRMYPGQVNLACFFVGMGQDAYAFELEGIPLANYASLVDGTSMDSVLHGAHGGPPIPVGEWLEASGPLMVVLLLCPPSSCQEGDLAVHVRQRSTGREATVEFSLDARAAGPGCFTV